ncbi:hypothetical protein STEG23_036513 [Scotinomys teguina]
MSELVFTGSEGTAAQIPERKSELSSHQSCLNKIGSNVVGKLLFRMNPDCSLGPHRKQMSKQMERGLKVDYEKLVPSKSRAVKEVG